MCASRLDGSCVPFIVTTISLRAINCPQFLPSMGFWWRVRELWRDDIPSYLAGSVQVIMLDDALLNREYTRFIRYILLMMIYHLAFD